MLRVDMAASIRKVTGKGAMRQLRMKGITPAVVYGAGEDSLPLQLETRPFYQQLLEIYRRNAIVTLTLDDGSVKDVLVQDVQTDPIKDTLVHADFIEIDINKPRQFNVPVNFQGNPEGCDLGGVLNIANHFVTVVGEPLNIPDEIAIDISHLQIGDKIVVDNLAIPSDITQVSANEDVLVSVVIPSKADEIDDEDVEAMADEAAPTDEASAEGDADA